MRRSLGDLSEHFIGVVHLLATLMFAHPLLSHANWLTDREVRTPRLQHQVQHILIPERPTHSMNVKHECCSVPVTDILDLHRIFTFWSGLATKTT